MRYTEGHDNDKSHYTLLEADRINLDQFSKRKPEILKNGMDKTGALEGEFDSDERIDVYRQMFIDLIEFATEMGKSALVLGAHSQVMRNGVAIYLKSEEFHGRTMKNGEIVKFQISRTAPHHATKFETVFIPKDVSV